MYRTTRVLSAWLVLGTLRAQTALDDLRGEVDALVSARDAHCGWDHVDALLADLPGDSFDWTRGYPCS